MIVTKDALPHILKKLKAAKVLAVDCETSGLRPFHNDRLFSIAICDGDETYYFNFQSYAGLPPDQLLDIASVRELFIPRTWIGHNLKFDIHFLEKEKLPIEGHLHDTMVIARILYNDHMRYSLDECAKRDLGAAKDDAVMTYILENSLYRTEFVPGQSKPQKVMFFDKVPFEIMVPYAEKDVRLTWDLYKFQMEQLAKEPTGERSLMNIYALECILLRVCVDMEKRGIKIDREYCEKAVLHERERIKKAEAWYEKTFGKKFVDSPQELKPHFAEIGVELPKTDAGNESIDSQFLEYCHAPIAAVILEHRDATKRMTTYFTNYLYYADQNDIIHPSMRQSGTRTGRFSYYDPNLQNIPSEDQSTFPVRRAFIPRPGHYFVSIDYDQQELRMMLDYAGEKELIEKIMAGLDPHQATADMVGIERRPAKTIAFGLIYGMGIQKLADSLGITYDQARALKYKYFGKLEKVKKFIYGVSDAAKARGYVISWLGRRFAFPNSDFAYKAPNALIQGGCADVTKTAMNDIHTALGLRLNDAAMVVAIHDEIVFEVAIGNEELVDMFRSKMEAAYPQKLIPLTTSTAFSLESLCDADLIEVEGENLGQEIRNKIQGQSPQGTHVPAKNVVRENSATVH